MRAVQILKAGVSLTLRKSPCAMVSVSYGWSGNMERIQSAEAHRKADELSTESVTHSLVITLACLVGLVQWFLTPGPRAKNGPRGLSKWPARHWTCGPQMFEPLARGPKAFVNGPPDPKMH